MESTVKFFKNGMRLKDLTIFYSNTVKPITTPGLRFKLIQELGEEEYKKIREANIKHPNHRKYYESKRTSK